MNKALNHAIFSAMSAALAGTDTIIRRAYANPSPPPPPENQNILYYHLIPEQSAPLEEDSISGSGNPSAFRFAAYRLILTIYGPEAEELAWRIYHRLYRDGYLQPRQFLRRAGIYPIPHPPGPQLVWEEWEKQHRPRADLTIPLRIATEHLWDAEDVGTLDAIPEIILE